MAFDPYDKNSWYFGPMGRRDAENMLNLEEDVGVFLVRDSTTCKGDLVLCVKEDTKISHYIIQKINVTIAPDATRNGNSSTSSSMVTTKVKFRIGDNSFADIPALLTFYKNQELDTTRLIRPVRKAEQVIALYDFTGRDPDDLPFTKDEILTILKKHEEKWWVAKNSTGRIGCIPVNYVKVHEESFPWSMNGSTCNLAEPLVSTNSATTITSMASNHNHHHPANICKSNIQNNNNNNVDNNNGNCLLIDKVDISSVDTNMSDESSTCIASSNGKRVSNDQVISSAIGTDHCVSSSSDQQQQSQFPVNGNRNECHPRQLSGGAVVVNSSSIDTCVSDMPDCSSTSSPSSSSSPAVSSSSANCISSQMSTLHLNDNNSQSNLLETVSARPLVPPTAAARTTCPSPSPAHPTPLLPVTLSNSSVVTDSPSSTVISSCQLTSNDTTSSFVSPCASSSSSTVKSSTSSLGERKLPALARVIQKHTPNAYDRTALKLEVRKLLARTLICFLCFFSIIYPLLFDRYYSTVVTQLNRMQCGSAHGR